MKKYSFLAKIIMSLMPESKSKKALLKFIIQTAINILAAVMTALGATSCMVH